MTTTGTLPTWAGLRRRVAVGIGLAIVAAVGCAPSPAESESPAPPAAPLAISAPRLPAKADMGKWAGIEVGSKGVKPIVMEFFQTPEGWDFNTDTTLDSRNTDLGTLAADNRGFDAARLADTVRAVTELDKALREKHKLAADRVQVVVSSGVFTRFADKAAAAKARGELAAAVEKAIGRAPDFINEQQEAELAARAIVGSAGRAGRMVVDIGSGNTKFGWYTGTGFQSFTLDSGTKAFHDDAAKQAGAKKQSFAEAAAALSEPTLAAPLRAKVAKADGFAKVTEVQLIGGAAWALATFTHPGTSKVLRVRLGPDDVKAFAEMAKLPPDEARAKAVSGLTDDAAKAAGAKEVERVQKVFPPEQLQAAAAILGAAFAEAKLGDKKVAFFQKGQYAWLAGYLMTAAKLPE